MEKAESQLQKEESQYKRATIGELCEKFGVSRPTMRRYLKTVPDLGERLGHWFNNVQVKKIYDHLGVSILAFFALLFTRASEAMGKNNNTYYHSGLDNSELYASDNPDSYRDHPLFQNPAVLLSVMALMVYKMVFNMESLIRRFTRSEFQTSGTKSNGRKLTMLDVFHISFSTAQIIITIFAFAVAGYYVGLKIFHKV